ncbi:hypothetical protein SDC9_197760 [bioreactor metagenome]|uniref:Uncharacterized protein n=1 Tax=bioreactor metagenome TaxID=1076179 RepID=A0A645IP65_9ZZZZ
MIAIIIAMFFLPAGSPVINDTQHVGVDHLQRISRLQDVLLRVLTVMHDEDSPVHPSG